ncbi:AAA family ATPase [Deinococcus altitudinis]|uniref:AAA family ATPase n=1 Tax=Deinococcus altitudinis TaxID=468914 RepID=UPI0038920D86
MPDPRVPASVPAPRVSDPLPGLSAALRDLWWPLATRPLLVLVGVTGVGKSTALAALDSLNLLPDRREVTDAVMILPQVGGPVSDREQRFALTARYRQSHPGGMAQAVGSLHADPSCWSGELVFDGLRGQDEVEYAAEHFPHWRFVSLHAPDVVRVRRLLGRADRFDMVGTQTGPAPTGPAPTDQAPHLGAALAALGGATEVFGQAELAEIAALEAQGFAPADILAKTRIVVSERRNYDPQAARQVLGALPAGRSLDLDTSLLSPEEVARAIRAWLPRDGTRAGRENW